MDIEINCVYKFLEFERSSRTNFGGEKWITQKGEEEKRQTKCSTLYRWRRRRERKWRCLVKQTGSIKEKAREAENCLMDESSPLLEEF